MSSSCLYEFGFSCPHEDCFFKSKKFDSIEAVNMHITKMHGKTMKLESIKDKNGRLRLILRRK